MKKTYGVANVNQTDYVKSAGEQGSSSAVERPLVKFDGEFNPRLIAGEFSLPLAKETQEATLEVAHRILGILVTKDLLAHLPSTVTGEHIGNLLPFYPFSYHKRFGFTYTDRVCPASTRTGRCAVCDGRMELFKSEAYKSGSVTKDDIMKQTGFGTKQTALVISRVYFNGEDLGIRCWTTALTNEQASNAKHDNFFDMVAQLATPKKLLAGEVLPSDYYSNGDGARWLVAEYVRATYQDEGGGDAKSKRAPAPYWKLSKITPMKAIEGVGKASDIWWPELGKGKDAKDGTELVDVYALVNHSPAEELAAATRERVDAILNPRKQAPAGQQTGQPPKADTQPVRYEDVSNLEAPSWEDLLAMEVDELVKYGAAKGGSAHDLSLTGAANIAALRRCVASLWKVTPQAVRQPANEPTADDERLPF
jgi:hypothetical protein